MCGGARRAVASHGHQRPALYSDVVVGSLPPFPPPLSARFHGYRSPASWDSATELPSLGGASPAAGASAPPQASRTSDRSRSQFGALAAPRSTQLISLILLAHPALASSLFRARSLIPSREQHKKRWEKPERIGARGAACTCPRCTKKPGRTAAIYGDADECAPSKSCMWISLYATSEGAASSRHSLGGPRRLSLEGAMGRLPRSRLGTDRRRR